MVLEVERSRRGAPLPLRRLRLGFANNRALSRIAAFFNHKIAMARHTSPRDQSDIPPRDAADRGQAAARNSRMLFGAYGPILSYSVRLKAGRVDSAFEFREPA
jgi:hypothetical protein